VALVTLVDSTRQWFKARVGLEVDETPRDVAFCAHAIFQDDILEVYDATQDERFAANPLVLNDPNIRFYAGAPLVTPTGHGMGTLCVIDHQPRRLSPEQKNALRALSRQVVQQLEMRLQMQRLTESLAGQMDTEDQGHQRLYFTEEGGQTYKEGEHIHLESRSMVLLRLVE
jgi:GAF domain-containing protein